MCTIAKTVGGLLLLGVCRILAASHQPLAPDIPTDAPHDALMASPAQVQELQDWARLVFTGRKTTGHEPLVRIEVLKQEHSVLHLGQSCIDTPIRLGGKQFQHGLGTHANSELLLHLPDDAAEFRSVVGIDNNADTGGVRGSVQFSIEIAGKEVLRTPTLRGTNQPFDIRLSLPSGTREITLKVDTTPDGPGHDQADWADARIIRSNGHVLWADEDTRTFLGNTVPFSFRLGGKPSAGFLADWRHSVITKETASRTIYESQWKDPATSLMVSATVTAFKRYPAVEWVLQFQNNGTGDTPLIEDIQALDTQLATGYARKPVRLHQLVGDVCGERSFLPFETAIDPGKPLVLSPNGGRSSNGTFPFFNLQYGEDQGLIAAVGWSGQWKATLDRSAAGPTAIRADIEKTSLRLHPGEAIRTARILVMPWTGDRMAAHNRFRRLLLFEYAPRVAGHPAPLPVALQSYDRYVNARPDWGTEKVQLQVAKAAKNVGCDTHWLDAAWFEGGFPDGVGNWYVPKDRFPRGLKPIGDACHEMGMKFMVWFEPERVGSASQVSREHPEFVFGGSKGGLYKLNDPEARQWMTDLLSKRIDEFALDTYRNDFNIDPLAYWRAADAPDRQGMTEIRYVEGHYSMWDTLVARHPGLLIDNCASGGRRIDLETTSRSLPHWRSDTGCSPGHADWNQTQTLGLSLYVPLFGACSWTTEAYDLRSAATSGAMCQFAVLDADFPLEKARAGLAEVKENSKYWFGDFYPLTASAIGPEALVAYQLHRADLDGGIILAFRRAKCPYPVLQADLQGLNPKARYDLEFVDEARAKQTRTVSAKDLISGFELRVAKPGTSLLVRYKRASK